MKSTSVLIPPVLLFSLSATFSSFAEQNADKAKKPKAEKQLAAHSLGNIEQNKKTKKVEALDESFLLFLAEIEEVDGELMHPIDIQATQVKKNKRKAKKDED